MRTLIIALILGALPFLPSLVQSQDISSLTGALGGDPLTGGLATSLGIDSDQAAGGVGSILSFAQNSLPAADYASLAGFLPDSDKYIKAAQDAGVLTDPITDIGRLNSAMQKLGIDADTASSMYSQLGDFVGQAGGESTQTMLMDLLK